jgi:tRNA-splicing ligase RtcB (3'-phosphate/5'-hydroxy nucleic acid ligase)
MIRVIGDTKAPVKIWASDLEAEAEQQVRNMAGLPFIHSHVAVMPDAHAGKGSTVGTVIATKGAIIPAAVGVDIGCGMCAVKLPLRAEELKDLKTLRSSIERSIPVGRDGHKEVTDRVGEALNQLGVLSDVGRKRIDLDRSALQCGTLGGGNHFIEVCTDTEGGAWVVLHSGSRNLGKTLADIHIDRAKGLMKSYFLELPDPDLAYLAQGTEEFNDYLKDLHFAQKYAKANRNEMMLRILKDVSFHVYGEDKGPEAMTVLRVDCHHNYTAIENHGGKNIYVTRKGAVSAREGELGIIPGSMGAKSFIVKGKGNPDSFHSCSHGAGRKMSRTKAKQMFTVDDLAKQTDGVECRKDADVIDEIPGSYKDIDEVMRNQADLVEPIYELKQLICIKG